MTFGSYTVQSSTYGKYSSYKAVDGRISSSCSQTTGKEVPWWTVVLDGVYDIRMLAINGRFCK